MNENPSNIRRHCEFNPSKVRLESELSRAEMSRTQQNHDEEVPAMQVKVDERSHFISTMALCLCTLCNAYLLISPFPYAGYMSIHLIPEKLTFETAGPYAGLLSSSFMFGRACSSYTWGQISDIYGRKSALQFSLLLSLTFSILFGLSKTYTSAIISRFMLGFTSCIMVMTKTLSAELSFRNRKLETRSMGLVVGMRGWGFLISPGLSGFLSDPVKQHPSSNLLGFQPLLSQYPYLLPNIVAAIFCLIAFCCTEVFVEETLPEEKRRSMKWIVLDMIVWLKRHLPSRVCRLCESTGTRNLRYTKKYLEIDPQNNGNQQLLPSETSSLLDSQLFQPTLLINETKHKESAASFFWARSSTRTALLLYWLWSFVVMSLDEAFPLFCLSREAGLGLTEDQIGEVLTGSGLLYVIFQYFVFDRLMNHLGMVGSLRISSFLGMPPSALIPLSLLMNNNVDAKSGRMSTGAFALLCIILAFCRIFASSYFASISIALNRSVPHEYRGKLQGLSMGGSSLFKGIGPTFTGIMFTFCISSGIFDPRVGSFVAFFVIASLGLAVALTTVFTMKEEENGDREG